ncbi:DUF4192 domain-containing protein [Leifsonia sp. A12D58]|uniref:DUF4192 domain-containing protein n=1 Tax=Leifsonia sp. A12D58 TaxID=3397674 RepID=UPI0039E1F562
MQPTIVKAKGPQDLLALVPQLSGFVPENSVILVAFRGSRTCGALRFNLPDPDLSEAVYKRIATTIVGTLCRLPGVDAVVPVLYTDDRFDESVGLPHQRFATTLLSRIESSGFVITDALCVGSDGWGSFLDPECPGSGRPLSAIAQSPLNDVLPEERAQLGRLLSRADLPEVDRASKERFGRTYRRYLAAVHAPDAAMALIDTLTDLLDPVELAELALEWDPDDLAVDEAVALLLLVQSPANRDQMMLQFAFGKEQGIESYILNQHYAAIQRSTGQSMDDIVRDELEQHAADRAADLTDRESRSIPDLGSDLILGMTDERPDPERIERALALLKRVVALAPKAARPAPLCILAWLSWALGRGSVAGIFLDRALAIDPSYGMALLLNTVMSSGHLPEWAFAEQEGDEE